MNIVPAKRAGRAAVKGINSIVDFTVLVIILALVAAALYAIWDSNQVYRAADARQYTIYKPNTKEDSLSFSKLQAINPEVFAWLTVYGTNIDYPVTQGENNEKYVITNVFGDYSLSGAIFLDSRNHKDFQDFNSILYGHHMEKQAMFGEIGSFSSKRFFEARAYGNLYYAGKNHGLEFFAFVHTDAYDASIFAPRIQGREAQKTYLKNLLDKAMYTRDIGVTTEDRILLLSTCSTDSTNGRDILFARITDKCYTDTFTNKENDNLSKRVSADWQIGMWGRFPACFWAVLPVILVILIIISIIVFKKRCTKRE